MIETFSFVSFSTVFQSYQDNGRVIIRTPFMEGCVQWNPGPEVIKLFSCSTQLSMKFFLLINIKIMTVVGILTFMNRKNSILGLYEPDKC